MVRLGDEMPLIPGVLSVAGVEMTQWQLTALVALHGLLSCAGDKCEWGEAAEAACHVADEFQAAIQRRIEHP